MGTNENRYNVLPVHGWFWHYCYGIKMAERGHEVHIKIEYAEHVPLITSNYPPYDITKNF